MRRTTLPLVLALLLASVLTQPRLAASQVQPAHVEITSTGDLFADVAGGRERGVVYLDDLDPTLTLDLHRLLGWPGVRLFLYGLGSQGGQPSRLAGIGPEHPRGTHVVFGPGDGALLAVEGGVFVGGGPEGNQEAVSRRRVSRLATPRYAARFGLGVWAYASPLPTFGAAPADADSWGAYALGE